jgi:CheY-like chemotaxis protein
MRKLKLDDKALQSLLDELDAQDTGVESTEGGRREQFFRYRLASLCVELDISRDETQTLRVPSRKLGSGGVYFLVSNLVHPQCTCRVHLVTVRNNWQTVLGRVEKCRYLQGTPGLHEVKVRFDAPVDPASFAANATNSRILVADDSEVSQKLCCLLLATMNAELTCVADGLEAVNHALTNPYDLILMDLEMPEMDGLTAVRMLRGRGYLRAIVAVSALDGPADRQRTIEAGCDDFLAKPLTRAALAEVVNRNKPEPLVSALLHEAGMTEVIDQFVDKLPDVIMRLEAAHGSADVAELAREARRVKGEAAGVGFDSITAAAGAVEEAANAGAAPNDLRPRLTDLIRLCMAARPATSQVRPPAVEAAATPDASETEAERAEMGEDAGGSGG